MSICRVPSAGFSQAPWCFDTSPPVSVCGTVTVQLKLRGFSWKLGIAPSEEPKLFAPSPLVVAGRICLPSLTTGLDQGVQHLGGVTLLRPPIALHGGTGILTRFPSTTLFSLALGADSPDADERCVGNLGLSAKGLFTPFIATHVSIRTSDTSREPLDSPSQAYRTLPYHAHRSVHPQLRLVA